MSELKQSAQNIKREPELHLQDRLVILGRHLDRYETLKIMKQFMITKMSEGEDVTLLNELFHTLIN